MASIRIIKKNVDYLFGDLIDECYVWMIVNPADKAKDAEKIVEEIMDYYDDLRPKLTSKNVENPKEHFAKLVKEAEDKANSFVEKINNL
jgi:hypothetical protein